jgi:ABC-2 type transport system permease protein
MDLIYYAVNIAFFRVLFLHTELIGGWTSEQMMVFVASYLLVDAINMTVFSTNMWWLPFYINRGELDYYLTRPVSPLFFLSLREFAANSFVNLFVALGIFVYAVAVYSGPWGYANLAGLILLLMNGVLIYYCIQMLMIIPVFWTQSARGFVDLFYTVGIAMERPDRIYRGFLRIFFTVIMPFCLIASYPVRVFLEGFQEGVLLHLTMVSLGLWIFMLSLWKRGLRNYASASS